MHVEIKNLHTGERIQAHLEKVMCKFPHGIKWPTPGKTVIVKKTRTNIWHGFKWYVVQDSHFLDEEPAPFHLTEKEGCAYAEAQWGGRPDWEVKFVEGSSAA